MSRMVRLTKQAQEAITKRGIATAWIEAAINMPDRTERDPRHPERTRSCKAIARLQSPAAALAAGRSYLWAGVLIGSDSGAAPNEAKRRLSGASA
jgi:hypothetical protein